MTCSDVERLLPEILDNTPNSEFQIAFDNHLKSCRDCSDLVSDLKLITNEAQYLVASEEPSSRVWEGISTQLKLEGLIREPRRSRLVPALLGHRWGAWLVAPVAAALIAASSYIVTHKPAPKLAQQQAPAIPNTAPAAPAMPAGTDLSNNPNPVNTADNSSATKVPRSTPSQESSQRAELSKDSIEPAPGSAAPSSSAPSSEDEQFLTAVSTNAPSMRATYENQLQAVNADIRETQTYVDHNPGDIDARQHLMDAYQQKALLYQIALDRIQ